PRCCPPRARPWKTAPQRKPASVRRWPAGIAPRPVKVQAAESAALLRIAGWFACVRKSRGLSGAWRCFCQDMTAEARVEVTEETEGGELTTALRGEIPEAVRK